jgi:hypothetical protein
MELKKGEYQGALRMLSGAEDALQHALSATRRCEDNRKIGRSLEDAERLLKQAKRQLRLD